MREIRYKVWHKSLKAFFFPYVIDLTTNSIGEFVGVCKAYNNDHPKGIEFNYNDVIWLQCTNSADALGITVYDSDILEDGGELYVVVWDDNQLCWDVKPTNGEESFNLFPSTIYKLVGNIHSTPELLK